MSQLDKKIFCLIKFGSEKNMLKLINNGELRFSLSKEYNDLVDNQERGDLYEGAEWIENTEFKSIEVDHPTLGKHTFNPVKGKLGKLTQFNYYYLSYSLYAISTRTFSDKDIHKIDESHLEFGDSAVLIKEPYKFLNAITLELKKRQLQYEMNFVYYTDYEQEGKILISPFTKKNDHSHQMEFRIIIENLNGESEFITIGGIEDYCQLIPSKTVVEMEWKAKRKEKSQHTTKTISKRGDSEKRSNKTIN